MGAARPFRQAGEMWCRKDSKAGVFRRPSGSGDEAENRPQRRLDLDELTPAQRPGDRAEAGRIDRLEVLDRHARPPALHLDLGTKRARRRDAAFSRR
jgi:hypothetical protein